MRAGGRIESMEEIGEIVVATRGGVPVRIRDRRRGVDRARAAHRQREPRTGSEVVVGTALMLIGGNSRTVAAAVEPRSQEIDRALPPGIVRKDGAQPHPARRCHDPTVATNLAEGALLVIVVLFLLLGNFRAALITALVIPVTMLLTATGMLQAKVSANLMSLGALDFGLIVDGAVIIAENSLRRLAERQHQLGRLLACTSGWRR